jgi:RNA polymerase sigma-70 factor (ECF subfamily)
MKRTPPTLMDNFVFASSARPSYDCGLVACCARVSFQVWNRGISMGELSTQSTCGLQVLIDRHAQGDPRAIEALIERSIERLRVLARRGLGRFPNVRRWEQTDDVLQGACRRLLRALQSVRPPTVRDFFNLCSELIRRELIDLHRHHFGPQGGARHYATPPPDDYSDDDRRRWIEGASPSDQAPAIDAWLQRVELHERVKELPEELLEVVNLLWYQELTQDEAAAAIGVSKKSVGRRWREAKIILHRLLTARHA